ncbi:hypothetical protein B9Z19DRAFT_1061679 [Tuber borchii]|uniref:Chitin-binding type-4 domain-containing protein n=1 Tax=Tuber borchii TaxID=42251 RepID=A0A2T7A4K0_TUBBO|nr:hypothetical protein B9Z19DRAFT_1061679 [Tuber borchii]
MFEPKQWNVPEVVRATVEKSDGNLNPLQGDGSNFPCHGVAPEAPVATYLPGTSQSLKLKGSAVHGGGSGQMVITYDTNPTKNTVFRVMTSYMGDHPIKAAGNLGPTDRDPQGLKSELELWKLNPLSFTVPKGLPKGKAVVAWTWFNHIGNREMYMQCATVIIGGDETSMNAFEALPGMFKANIGGGCIVSDQITAIDFKHPGPEVFGKGITPVPCGEPSITGSGVAEMVVPGAGNYGQKVESSAGAAVTPTKTSSSSPPPPTGDNAGDDGVLTTYVTVTPSPTPSKEVNIQTPIPSAPTTLVASAIPYNPPTRPSAPTTLVASTIPYNPPTRPSAPTTLVASTIPYNPPTRPNVKTPDACTTEGEITCGENRTWYMCGSGRKQFMGSLAAGTSCTAGKIFKRGIRGYYF